MLMFFCYFVKRGLCFWVFVAVRLREYQETLKKAHTQSFSAIFAASTIFPGKLHKLPCLKMQGNWGRIRPSQMFPLKNQNNTPWKFNIAPENIPSQRRVVFQPSFFRGYVKLREGIKPTKNSRTKKQPSTLRLPKNFNIIFVSRKIPKKFKKRNTSLPQIGGGAGAAGFPVWCPISRSRGSLRAAVEDSWG